MKFPPILIVGLAAFGCTRDRGSIAGEWAGDLRHPAGTLPLEVQLGTSLDSATVSVRKWGLSKVPGYVVIRSDSLTVTVPTENDTVVLRGIVSNDAWTGMGSRGQDTAAFELRHLVSIKDSAPQGIIGSYRAEDGRLVGVDKFVEFGERTMLVNYSSGRIGPLLPISQDRFLLSRSIVAPMFPADTVEFARGPDGAVREIRVLAAGEDAVTATRIGTRDEDLTFDNGQVRLGATLTLPVDSGPHAALVLVHGSNAQPRESMGPWVRYFAGLGYAVLAYDKRGTGRSTGDWKQADFHVLASDALAGVRAIAKRKDIRADRIGLWGISQAGWIMPLVVSNAPNEIGFMIVHAGTGTPVWEQGVLNYRNELRFAGLPDSAVRLAIRYQHLNDTVTRTGKHLERQRQFYDAHRAQAPYLFAPAPLDAWFRGYYRMLMDFDPAESWKRVRIPVLLFFGELDANVPPTESWPPIERGLRAAANTKVTHVVLPKANHVFFAARTGASDEYPGLNRFVPGYFDRMAAWLRENVR